MEPTTSAIGTSSKRQRKASEKERERDRDPKDTRISHGRVVYKEKTLQYQKQSQGNDLRILPSVVLSEYDKAPQLLLCKDQLICHGYEVILTF